MINGESPELRCPGDLPAATPQDALRRTIKFLGAEGSGQNHWYMFDRATGELHQLEQSDSGVVLIAEEVGSSSAALDDESAAHHRSSSA